jgi:hypothetical protein
MSDLCPYCGEWGCGSECAYGTYDDDDDRPCTFCGSVSGCDKSGYNCPDDHYQEYNLHGWPEEVSGDA